MASIYNPTHFISPQGPKKIEKKKTMPNANDEGTDDAVDKARSNGDAIGFPTPSTATSPPENMEIETDNDEDDSSNKTIPADDAAVPGKAKKNGDDDDDDASDDDEDATSSPEDEDAPDDILLRAMTHKEDGNTHFKSSDFSSAARSYRKGTNLLKKLNEANSGEDQVKQLLITLQTNLSMVCFKQKKHRMSRDVASRALEIDDKNVKALYRRAVASRAMGDVDAAKSDLRSALKVEPNNVSIKKEWLGIKKKLEEQKKLEKARLSRAFSSKGGKGSLLYSDKEEEEERKKEEKKEKKRLEEEKKEKRKKEWEDECVRKMASDPPEEPISFDDWDKARKKKEEDEEKARKKAKKEEEDRKREERRKAKKAQKQQNKSNDSDDELTESEMAMLRGYKKTSDGRTTSYFNREQTEHEKQLIGCIKPKKLESSQNGGASPTSSTASGVMGSSVWNASGTTWEEKDTTEWCKKTFEQCLLDTTTAYYSTASHDATYVAVVKKVNDVKGDASVAIAGGKKRYIYDFHASIEYDVLDDEQKCIASGVLKLPDVNSATTADEDELEVDIMGWKKAPAAVDGGEGDRPQRHLAQDAIECRKLLVQDVRKSVLQFVEKFNANF